MLIRGPINTSLHLPNFKLQEIMLEETSNLMILLSPLVFGHNNTTVVITSH